MALTSLRILDLSRLLPGPYCTHLLADLGAEVIKIEQPGKGDGSRELEELPGISSYFLQMNRNKQSLAVNLKSDEGRRLFLELSCTADVIVESFRPGVVDRLGIGYDAVCAVNPRIIYCSISGYGQDGPYRDWVGHDINYVGFGGILGLAAAGTSQPAQPGIQISDIGGGTLAAVGILAAVVERNNSGKGQFIDLSMLDGVVSALSLHGAQHLLMGETTSSRRLIGEFPCYNLYQTADGYSITLGALEAHFWANFCHLIGHPEFISDQFSEGGRRAEIFAALRAYFSGRSREELVDQMAKADVGFGVVQGLGEVFTDPQVVHREMVVETAHPVLGTVRQIGCPLKLSRTPAQMRSPAPELGQQTAALMVAAGYSLERIDELQRQGVVQLSGLGPAPVRDQ